MEHLRHNGNLWQKLVCFFGALLIFSAPVTASVCPHGQCVPDRSKAAGQCHELAANNNNVALFQVNLPLPCCQLAQNPPATIVPASERVEVLLDTTYVIAEAESLRLPAISRLPDNFEVTFSPPDIQSLLCILLV